MPSVLGFLPSTNGLRFVNAWPDEPVVVVSVPGFGAVKIGNASNGLCGGMVFLVRDVFEARLPPIRDAQPAQGTPLYDYIVQRLIASYHLPSGVLQYFGWMNTPDADGGFYSAEDADSVPPESAAAPNAHKTEGAFYLWRADEIDALLGDDSPIVKLRFGIEPGGNAPHDPQQEFTGKNLLYAAHSIDEIAQQAVRTPDEIVEVLHRARLRMFQERLGRPRPHRDDKVLTSWNGLMIAAFARMARVLRGPGPDGRTTAAPFLDAARRAAAFIRERMWNAYAEDYAYLIAGLIELFQADAAPVWLEWAIALQHRQDELFWDDAGGGWFSTTGHDPSVLLRMKEDYDGAEPTASSVSVLNLLVLSHLVSDARWGDRIERTLRLFGTRLEQMGRGVPLMAAALSAHTAGLQQIIIVEGDGAADGTGPAGADLDRAVTLQYLPFAIHLRVTSAGQRALAASLPFIDGMRPIDGVTTAYVCRAFTCHQPVTTVEALQRELGNPA